MIEPREFPSQWVRWRATDWGYASPFCTLWFTKDPAISRIYAYRELYAAELADSQQAELIKEATPANEKIMISYADPSLWERKNLEGQVSSTAEVYKKHGVMLTRGDNNRLSGIRKVHQALADLPDGLPGLQITEDCLHLIDQLSNLARDDINPEDVDTDQEDHAFDTLKYGLTNQKRIQPAPPPKNTTNPVLDNLYSKRRIP